MSNLVLYIYLTSAIIVGIVSFGACNAFWKFKYLGQFDGKVGQRYSDFVLSVAMALVNGTLSIFGLMLAYKLTEEFKYGFYFKVDFEPNKYIR